MALAPHETAYRQPEPDTDDAYDRACEQAVDRHNHPNCGRRCPHPAHQRSAR